MVALSYGNMHAEGFDTFRTLLLFDQVVYAILVFYKKKKSMCVSLNKY